MKWSSVWSSAYTLAAFTAIFGFVFAVILQRIQDRRTPRKAISWDAEVERPARLKEGERARIGISYNGTRVENLFQVKIRIENSGNTVVKNEYLRFKMPEGARLLEMSPYPVPEQELRVEEVDVPALDPTQRRYKIGHLEAGQSVGFLIVTDGGAWPTWTDIHPHNDEGGVRFEQRDIARAKEDAESVQPFIRNVSAFLLLTILVFITPTPASWALSGLALIPGTYIFTAAPRIMRVILQLTGKRSQNLFTVTVRDSKGVQIGDDGTQLNTYSPASSAS
jgi:hypothetical protein